MARICIIRHVFISHVIDLQAFSIKSDEQASGEIELNKSNHICICLPFSL